MPEKFIYFTKLLLYVGVHRDVEQVNVIVPFAIE